MPFRQPAIPPEQEGEMQERAWSRIMGEAARLAERDREVAARERRVREKEEAVARGALQVLLDPEGDTRSTDVKEGPYQDRPLLCPFRLLPLLTCSGSAIAFLKIQGPKSKNIESTILLQP